MTAIVNSTVEQTMDEPSVTEIPTILTSTHFTPTEESESEVEDFTHAYDSRAESDPYDYNDYNNYALNHENEESSKVEEIDPAPQENKVDNGIDISSNDQSQTSFVTSTNDDVSNVDEKPEKVFAEDKISSNEEEEAKIVTTIDDQGLSNASPSDDVSNVGEKSEEVFTEDKISSNEEEKTKIITTIDDQGLSNASPSDDVSNVDEKPEEIFTEDKISSNEEEEDKNVTTIDDQGISNASPDDDISNVDEKPEEIFTEDKISSNEEEKDKNVTTIDDQSISNASPDDDISNVDEKPEEIFPEDKISSSEEEKAKIVTTIDNQDLSNASPNDVSNEKFDEKTYVVVPTTAQSKREITSRASSTDSFQTDVSEKESCNVSDHESDTSYEKDESEKDEKVIEPVDQGKIRPDSGEEKLIDATTEAENEPDPIEEELPSERTSDKSEDNSGENKLGKSLDYNVNNLVVKIPSNSSEEIEDKSGENGGIEEKLDEFVENSSSKVISEPVFDDEAILKPSESIENQNLDDTNYNDNQENNSLIEKDAPLYIYNGEDPQNIPGHGMGILSSSTSFSSFSSEHNQDVRDSITESYTSKYSSFSSISMHQSIDFTNGIENQDVILDKNALNRLSVASLRENPELNDISLDDDSLNVESPREWSFSDWGFPRTPTSLKTISSFFSQRPTTPTVTSMSSISSSSSDSRRMSTISMTSTGSNYDLLLARLERENQLLQEDPKAKRMSLQGMAEIKASFERAQHEAQIDDGIDWDFWGQIISDYEAVARSQPRQLSKMIQKGIPQNLRGMIWQLMSKSKDSELESTYAQLLKETSPHEKMIMRDLNRTFPKHAFFQDQDGRGQEGLFNVVKAYSLYDTDVGYCQGISFVVGPLLLNMPDEEAFCVLVKLMKFYNMRSHFLPGMDGLQLRLYQFDRLVEEMLPKVHNHLQVQGINSSMYASQWFMTLFAYKFPLSLVFRIYDTIFTEGIEAIFRFSIALLKKNEKRIVEMEFEKLLEYLKSGLFENYQVTHTGVLAQLVTETQYHTNDFVKDAYNIRITTKKLKKYQEKYYAQQEAEKRKSLAEAEAVEKLRSNNNQLSNRVKQLESTLQTLNREHVELANELINTKMGLAKSNDENDELNSIIAELHKTIESQPAEIEAKLREEMNILAEKNVNLVQRNNALEDQLANLENMLIESKMKYAESENEREVLRRKWNDLKKALG